MGTFASSLVQKREKKIREESFGETAPSGCAGLGAQPPGTAWGARSTERARSKRGAVGAAGRSLGPRPAGLRVQRLFAPPGSRNRRCGKTRDNAAGPRGAPGETGAGKRISRARLVRFSGWGGDRNGGVRGAPLWEDSTPRGGKLRSGERALRASSENAISKTVNDASLGKGRRGTCSKEENFFFSFSPLETLFGSSLWAWKNFNFVPRLSSPATPF